MTNVPSAYCLVLSGVLALCERIIDKAPGMGYKTSLTLSYDCQETGSLSFL